MTDEKIPFQKPLIGTIIPGRLLVGNDAAGRDEHMLRLHSVTDVIDLRLIEIVDQPNFPGINRYRFPMIDGPGNDMGVFRAAIDCLWDLAGRWGDGGIGATYVHCLAGHSRSVCLATVFWAMSSTPALSFGEALAAVKALYPPANPNPFTAKLARDYLQGAT